MGYSAQNLLHAQHVLGFVPGQLTASCDGAVPRAVLVILRHSCRSHRAGADGSTPAIRVRGHARVRRARTHGITGGVCHECGHFGCEMERHASTGVVRRPLACDVPKGRDAKPAAPFSAFRRPIGNPTQFLRDLASPTEPLFFFLSRCNRPPPTLDPSARTRRTRLDKHRNRCCFFPVRAVSAFAVVSLVTQVARVSIKPRGLSRVTSVSSARWRTLSFARKDRSPGIRGAGQTACLDLENRSTTASHCSSHSDSPSRLPPLPKNRDERQHRRRGVRLRRNRPRQ